MIDNDTMRIKIRRLLLASLYALILVSIIWQFAEAKITVFAEKAAAALSGKPFNQIRVVDAAGIPQQLYSDGLRHYNPLFIAVEATDNFEQGNIPRGILLSDWLLDNLEITDSTAIISYDFDFPPFKQRAPWQSALTQAVLMVTLAQRAVLNQEPELLEISDKILQSLTPQSADLSYELADGALWFMEYPAPTPYYSMSGMMSVLIKLDLYHQLTGSALAMELFERGYAGFKSKLPEFDFHGYSYYNLDGVKPGRMYSQRHFRRLAELIEVRPDPLLVYYQERWERSDRLPVLWQFIFNPRPKRILAFALGWLAMALVIAWIMNRDF